MNKSRKIIAVVVAVVVIVLFAAFLLIGGRPRIGQAMPLYRSAYDSLGIFYLNQNSITVYIRENGEWEPFLALESSYPGEGNGGVLLLRRYLIQERRPWSTIGNRELSPDPGVYYPLSEIDNWLETEYFHMFSPSIQDRILTTNIEVWDGFNHAPEGTSAIRTVTESMPRKVFLLSENEVGQMRGGATRAAEGEPIAYFHPGSRYGLRSMQQSLSNSRRAATPRDEYTGDRTVRLGGGGGFHGYSWWTRTVRWSGINGTIFATMHNGGTHHVINRDSTFVRPAFTMSRDTVIELYRVDGRMVYVIHD